MKQCKGCGRRDFEPWDVIFRFGESTVVAEDIVHRDSQPEHWPACDGDRCIEMMCPMEVEVLCGPIIELGHGGNMYERSRRMFAY